MQISYHFTDNYGILFILMANDYHFEYDDDKSQHNLIKHCIDFNYATKIWSDENYLEITARSINEMRYMVIGKIDHKHWSAIMTFRDDYTIKIISVRRSRKNEVELYESQNAR